MLVIHVVEAVCDDNNSIKILDIGQIVLQQMVILQYTRLIMLKNGLIIYKIDSVIIKMFQLSMVIVEILTN